MSSQVLNELETRGLVYQCTDREGLEKLLAEGSQAFYIGFDPTADSLHVGSLIPIIVMMHFQRPGINRSRFWAAARQWSAIPVARPRCARC